MLFRTWKPQLCCRLLIASVEPCGAAKVGTAVLFVNRMEPLLGGGSIRTRGTAVIDFPQLANEAINAVAGGAPTTELRVGQKSRISISPCVPAIC